MCVFFFKFALVGNEESAVPTPFHFLKDNVRKVYMENETNHLMGRLTTLDGKIWIKFLPSVNSETTISIRVTGVFLDSSTIWIKHQFRRFDYSTEKIH